MPASVEVKLTPIHTEIVRDIVRILQRNSNPSVDKKARGLLRIGARAGIVNLIELGLNCKEIEELTGVKIQHPKEEPEVIAMSKRSGILLKADKLLNS